MTAIRIAIILALAAMPARAESTQVCAECHADIYRSYSATPMAQSSGPVSPASAPAATAASFRVESSAHGVQVHFTESNSRDKLEATRTLDYFIGAGIVGRSYASSIDGFLFQSPVSYYRSTNSWDLSPGYENSPSLNMTRPIEPACLNCHAGALRALPHTVNGYATPAFADPGITCDRCHGPGEQHVARMKSGNTTPGNTKAGSGIVNPAHLNPAERDSVCAQCHLVGVVRVAKFQTAPYAPGGKLFDATSAFLWNGGDHQLAANSHFEQLIRSACWRNSAGKLWCGTCHDSHAVTPASEYRGRCLSCHTKSAPDCSAPAQQRRAASDNCATCHMPSKLISTVPHAAQIDHTIPRSPAAQPPESIPDTATLTPFPGSSKGDRELALAYAGEATTRNRRRWAMLALPLLQAALAAHPDDAASADQLAQIYDRMGRTKDACDLFAKAANAAPGALVNLGTCQASGGDLEAAIKSWSAALEQNPGFEPARLNLAVAQFRSGNAEAARASLAAALRFDPFSRRALDLLQALPPEPRNKGGGTLRGNGRP